MSSEPRPDAVRHAWSTPAALGLLAALMGILAAFAVPRLTNHAIGDIEFTGWSGPVARELYGGRAPYVDFVLPIPPGSMAILAGIHRWAGEPRLLHELGLIAVCQIALALLGYAVVRPLTSRENAVLVAFASAVILLRGFKECAYDHTAAVVAWSSVAFGARAILHDSPRARRVAWAVSGALAALTLFFKQSTAFGVLLGWPLALSYLLLVGVQTRAGTARNALAWGAGVGVGLALVAAGLIALGSSPAAFYQAAIADGPALKGGSRAVSSNLGHYLLASPIYPASLLLTAVAGSVIVRLSRVPGGLHLGDQDPAAPPSSRRAAIIAALAVLVFGAATLLVVLRARALPEQLAYWTDRLRFIPGFGLLLACLVCFAHLARARGDDDDALERWRRGHAWNALFALTLSISLAHNLSSPEFRPFYDPNPILPVAFAFVFVAFDKAALPRAKLVVFALALGALFSPRFDRVLGAQIAIGRHGHWGGLYVSEGALPIVNAALRARELANEHETVLVLPEDLQIAALIGRPRPPLRGAVVFVDQYAPRLVEGDLKTLEQNLPKVVVIRPAERDLWAIVFAHWNANSGARKIVDRFLDDWLPKHYRRDSSYVTRYGNRDGTLEIWVRQP